MSKAKYLAALQAAFKKMHGCEATHLETVLVMERRKSKTVWEGEVEVFALRGHPAARRGYAWSHDKEKGGGAVAVLELPPVVSAHTAVQAALVGLAKDRDMVTAKLYRHYFKSRTTTTETLKMSRGYPRK